MPKTLDYSFWRPNIADLKAAGIAGVCRYLSWQPNAKVIDRLEYATLVASGVPIMLNWESTGRSWRGAYTAGVQEGREARRQARALGHPDERPIVQSIDEGVPGTLLGTAVAYQRGFNDGGGCGPQGAYGTKLALDTLFDAGLIRVGWQTNARGWIANGADCARAALYQRTTHSFGQFPPLQYDESDVHLPDWGQHPNPGGPPMPTKPTLAAPVCTIVPTHTDNGYWLIAEDGGVFAFGDAAKFPNPIATIHLAASIVGAARTHDSQGLWLVGGDGGVFEFGNARHHGALPDKFAPAPGTKPDPTP